MGIRQAVCVFMLIVFTGCFSDASIEKQAGQKTEQIPEEFKTTPSLADLKFLSQLRKELGFGDVYGDTLIMLVGPFSSFEDFTIGGRVIHIDPSFRSMAYLIFMGGNYYAHFEHSFYEKLSNKERLFVIAHEAWHAKKHKDPAFKLPSIVLPDNIPTQELKAEIEADFYGANKVDDGTVVNFLSGYVTNMNELGWRVWSINQKQGVVP